MNKKTIQLVLLLAIFVLSYFIYESIMKPVRFDKAKNAREEVVIAALKDLRKAQVAFKSVHGRYASTLDSLLGFVKEGQLPIVFKQGVVPDSLTEAAALKLGLITRDSSFIMVRDSLFKHKSIGFIDSLRYVPFSGGNQYKIAAGVIDRSMVKVQVFEIIALKDDFLNGLNESYFGRAKDLQIGSMTEPSIDGNWE